MSPSPAPREVTSVRRRPAHAPPFVDLAHRRFALVAEEGVVTHLAVDQGSIELDETSAEAILSVLRPNAAVSVEEEERNNGAIAAVAAAAAAAAAYYYYVGDAGLEGLAGFSL